MRQHTSLSIQGVAHHVRTWRTIIRRIELKHDAPNAVRYWRTGVTDGGVKIEEEALRVPDGPADIEILRSIVYIAREVRPERLTSSRIGVELVTSGRSVRCHDAVPAIGKAGVAGTIVLAGPIVDIIRQAQGSPAKLVWAQTGGASRRRWIGWCSRHRDGDREGCWSWAGVRTDVGRAGKAVFAFICAAAVACNPLVGILQK
jgi:hypothetical protein